MRPALASSGSGLAAAVVLSSAIVLVLFLLRDYQAFLSSPAAAVVDAEAADLKAAVSVEGVTLDGGAETQSSNPRLAKLVTSIPAPKKCTRAQAAAQAKMLSSLVINGCSRFDIYLRLVHMINPAARVLFDIGSNKGYTGVELLSLWSSASVSPRRLHASHKAYTNRSDVIDCGMCNDCKQPNPVKGLTRSEVEPLGPLAMEIWRKYHAWNTAPTPIQTQVYSFDGNSILVDAVNAAIARMQVPSWSCETAAFSDEYTPGQTIKFIVNSEFGHIADDRAVERDFDKRESAQTVEAPLLTVDEVCRRKGISRIDLLKVDTEGFDAYVLRGAQRMLSKDAIDVLLFEYNKYWPFEKHSLESTTRWLADTHGFQCYVDGNKLVRLTGGCWAARLETRDWSNIWCASTRTPVGKVVVAIFDRLGVV